MVITLIILLLIISVVIVKILLMWKQLQSCNQRPLDIKTFDGSDSPYHPAVLYFKDGWNGYKYWMAETPFSPKTQPYWDRNECPTIHVSNDGINWTHLGDELKPIDDLTEQQVKELDFFSDPHLVFVDGRMECWYRLTHRRGDKNNYAFVELCRKVTTDGVHWTEREVLIDLLHSEVGNYFSNMVVSPAILREGNEYRMWYVHSEANIQREVHMSRSVDGYNWGEIVHCKLIGHDLNPWHIDVNYIDGKYYLVCFDRNDLTLWESQDGVEFLYKKQLLDVGAVGSFYGFSLYRAALIKAENYKLYFSGNNCFHTYIGLMEGDSVDAMTIKSPGSGGYSSLWGMLRLKYLLEKRRIVFIIKNTIRNIIRQVGTRRGL